MTEKKRILIVDDEPAVSGIIARFLENSGIYEVLAIDDPAQAVAAAREFRPDLVILDVMMAPLDGGEVLTELRREKEFSELQAMFLTGLVSEAEIGREGYHISGHPVIPKPVRPATLLALVARQLGIEETPPLLDAPSRRYGCRHDPLGSPTTGPLSPESGVRRLTL